MIDQPLPLLTEPSDRVFARGAKGPLNVGQLSASVQSLLPGLTAQSVALHLAQNRLSFMSGLLAVALAGGRNLLPPDRQTATARALAANYAGTQVWQDHDADDHGLPTTRLVSPETYASPSAGALAAAVSANAVAVVAHTSGSTGTPKPIVKTWRAVAHTAWATLERLYPPKAQVVATVPAQHMYGLETTVMVALFGDAVIDGSKPFLPAQIAAAMQQTAAPRVLVTTPVHMDTLLRSNVDLPAVERVISATAPLSAELAERFEKRFATQVWEIYGCTEGGSLATRRTVEEQHWRMLPGFDIQTEPNGDTTVSSPGFARRVVLPDQVTVRSPQEFELLGRPQDLINVGGKRASLAGLERMLLGLDRVEDAALTSIESQGRTKVVGLVVSDRKPQELLRELSHLVDPVFVPKLLRPISAVPRNETGKVQRSALLLALGESGES